MWFLNKYNTRIRKNRFFSGFEIKNCFLGSLLTFKTVTGFNYDKYKNNETDKPDLVTQIGCAYYMIFVLQM